MTGHLKIFLSVIAMAGPSLAAMPVLQSLEAKCGRSGMSVTASFDQPFAGIIYSKGHYDDSRCHYVTEAEPARKTYTFLVPPEGCGTRSSMDDPKRKPGEDMFYENVIIIQLDPLITEVWDSARRLRCVSPNSFAKTVQAEPFRVAEPQRVSLEFTEASVNSLSAVQRGAGPFDAPVTGYIHAGELTSLVLYVQDSSGTHDATVVNCSLSHGGGRTPLLDPFGCPDSPGVITEFVKSRESNGVKADLMLYAYLEGVRVPQDSPFSLQCQLQVCEGACAPPCAEKGLFARRRRRSVAGVKERGSLVEGVRGLLTEDPPAYDPVLIVDPSELEPPQQCRPPRLLHATVAVLLAVVALLSLLCCCLAYRLLRQKPSRM